MGREVRNNQRMRKKKKFIDWRIGNFYANVVLTLGQRPRKSEYLFRASTSFPTLGLKLSRTSECCVPILQTVLYNRLMSKYNDH